MLIELIEQRNVPPPIDIFLCKENVKEELFKQISNLDFLNFLQLNQMTSWIDASFVYSTKEAWVNAMRTFRNGTFKARAPL